MHILSCTTFFKITNPVADSLMNLLFFLANVVPHGHLLDSTLQMQNYHRILKDFIQKFKVGNHNISFSKTFSGLQSVWEDISSERMIAPSNGRQSISIARNRTFEKNFVKQQQYEASNTKCTFLLNWAQTFSPMSQNRQCS